MKTRAYLSEFIGTFALLFIGTGAVVTNGINKLSSSGAIGVALAFGLVIAAMASSVGPISGGHFNPAVTLGAWIGKRISFVDAIVYIFVQCAGAMFGVWLLVQALPEHAVQEANFGLPEFGLRVSGAEAMILEAVATFFLVFVVYGTAFYRRAPKMGALFVGLTISMDILAIGPITGAGMNPARWFGPAAFSGALNYSEQLKVYVAGPIIGGIIAAIIFAYFLEKHPEEMEGTGGPADDSVVAVSS